MKLLISGGKGSGLDFKKDEWQRCNIAVLLIVDIETKKIETIFEYNIDSNNINYYSEKSGILFKSFYRLSNNRLLLCTNTELLEFSISDRKIIKRITHSLMNDVHHAIFYSNKYYIANTGRDSVLILDKHGKMIDEIELIDHLDSVKEKNISDRFGDVDYRLIPSTKPHLIHPNHIVEINNQVWVTRFMQKDIFNIKTSETISIDVGNPHDGINTEFGILTTTTNGNLHIVKNDSNIIIPIYKCENYTKYYSDLEMGWMRGVCPVSEEFFWLGFSVLRPTKSVEFLIEFKNKILNKNFNKSAPTRIDLYSIYSKKIIESIVLENYIDLVYSIDIL